ncbi:MAG: cytochrome c maturation protein CcmE [Leptolinea sp.]
MQLDNSTKPSPKINVKFIIAGLLIVAAVVYLIISSTQASAQYFLTVDEVKSRGQEMVGKEMKISGSVLGDSIQYDPQSLTVKFTIAHVSGDNAEVEKQGGLAAVLHAAVMDPTCQKLDVIYKGVKPDLLKNEAQAIITGTLNDDGTITADELLLKCPTKYEEALPGQSASK